MLRSILLPLAVAVACASWPLAPFPVASEASCPGPGKVYGKIQIVESFPDCKVEVVESFENLRVQVVTSFPDNPGEWQMVESFPDYKVQIVESFPDFKIRYVESFPGVNE